MNSGFGNLEQCNSDRYYKPLKVVKPLRLIDNSERTEAAGEADAAKLIQDCGGMRISVDEADLVIKLNLLRARLQGESFHQIMYQARWWQRLAPDINDVDEFLRIYRQRVKQFLVTSYKNCEGI